MAKTKLSTTSMWCNTTRKALVATEKKSVQNSKNLIYCGFCNRDLNRLDSWNTHSQTCTFTYSHICTHNQLAKQRIVAINVCLSKYLPVIWPYYQC